MGRKSSKKQWEKKKHKSNKVIPLTVFSNEQLWDDQTWYPLPIADPTNYIHEQFIFHDGYETDENSGVKAVHNRPPHPEKIFESPPKMPSLFECSLIALKQKFSFNICNYILKDIAFNQYIKNNTIEKWHCRRATEDNPDRGWVIVKPPEYSPTYITV